MMKTKGNGTILSSCLTLLPPSVCACRSALRPVGMVSHSCALFFFFSTFSPVSQVQKQNYRQEKKRAAKELFSALKDPSVVIMANWLKVWKCYILDVLDLWYLCIVDFVIYHPSCSLQNISLFMCYCKKHAVSCSHYILIIFMTSLFFFF